MSRQGKLSLFLGPFPESPAWQGPASTTSKDRTHRPSLSPGVPNPYSGPPHHAQPGVRTDPSVPPWQLSPQAPELPFPGLPRLLGEPPFSLFAVP